MICSVLLESKYSIFIQEGVVNINNLTIAWI